MKLVLRFLHVAVIGALFSASASAVPVVWSVDGLSRVDGGTISGSFTYDADANGGLGAYSAINVTTIPPTPLLNVPGETYAGFDPTLTDENGPTLTPTQGGDLTGRNSLILVFPALTNAGGTLNLVNGREVACDNADCSAETANVGVTGSIFGTPVPTPTPTATPVPTLPLPLLGLLAAIILGFGLRRLRRG